MGKPCSSLYIIFTYICNLCMTPQPLCMGFLLLFSRASIEVFIRFQDHSRSLVQFISIDCSKLENVFVSLKGNITVVSLVA